MNEDKSFSTVGGGPPAHVRPSSLAIAPGGGGESMNTGDGGDNLVRGAGLSVANRSLASTVTSSTAGSCPTTSYLFSGRAGSPSPAIQRPTRACPSPISSIVGTALNQ